jgi:EmrB/QacA subfamily drug resistance transporter
MTITDTYARRWWALGLVSLAQFLIILDTSIIGIALPQIRGALGFSESSLQWVFNAYVIAFGGLLLLGGRLSDLLGARRLFVAGFAILVAASLLAGLAWSDAVLVIGRALQGLGAALIAPAAMTLVFRLFTTPAELGRAMGIWGAAAPAGGTAGVFLGGVITQWISWRWTFLINVPIGVLVLAATPALLPPVQGRRGRVDVTGALSVTAALSLAVYAIVTANDRGWGSAGTIVLLAVAGALLAVFVAVQSRRRDPLVPLRIFRTPNLSAANAVMLLLGAAWIPMWFYLNLYLQQVLGFGAFASGAALLPMTIAIMALMVGVTGRLVSRVGFKRPLVAGLLALAAGMLMLGRLPVGGSFAADVLGASLVAALGMSLSYIPALIASLSAVKPEETGLASGIVNTSYQIGSALGLAAMTAIAIAATDGPSVADLNHGFHAAFIGAATVAAAAGALAVVAIRSPRAEAANAVAEAALEQQAA